MNVIARWLGRRTVWSFLRVWTLLLVALLVAAWVWIFTSPDDDFGLNGVLAGWALVAAIVFWFAGAIVIAILASLIRRLRPSKSLAADRPVATHHPDRLG